MESTEKSEFEKLTSTHRRTGALSDLSGFLVQNKKWWLFPIVFVLLLFGVLVLFAGTGAAPFIYTLF